MIVPHTYQQPIVDKTVSILSSGGEVLINASETGTGKTVCALAALKQIVKDALVIAPLAVHTSWKRTAEAMDLTSRLHGVINIEKLQFKNPYFIDNSWKVPKNCIIIHDECHRGASGPKTNGAKIMALTKAWHIPVMAMSATVADTPVKLRYLGWLLGLHQFNTPNFNRWCLDHGCFRQPGRDQLQFPKGPAGQAIMAKIHAQIADRLVRLRVADIPDFPENQIFSQLFDLTERDTAEINEIYEKMNHELRKEHSDPLVAMLRARQKVELLKVPLLAELALEAQEEGKSPVIFVNFIDTLEALRALLPTFGFIHGGQKKSVQQQFKDAFQKNIITGMLMMSQMGIGNDLHDVLHERPRVSFITPSYSAVDMLQCLGRIARVGGTKVIQTFTLAANTIEERTHKSIQNKTANILALNDSDLT